MRDPKRIERLIDLIDVIWSKNPHLRFCQIIGNCYSCQDDTYYIEDKDLEKRLKEKYL